VAPLAARLTAVLRALGERCIARRAEVQRRLLLAVLRARAAPPPEDLDLRDLRHLDLRHLGVRWLAPPASSAAEAAEEAGRLAAIAAVERAVAAEAAAAEAAAANPNLQPEP